MNRSRALTAIATAALSASLLTGCGGSDEEEIRIAEPVLDFPQTSTTPTPTPTTTAADDEDEEDEDEDETTTSTTTTSSSTSSSTSTTTRSSARTSTRSNSGSRPGTTTYRPAPAPAPAPQNNNARPEQPGAACPWPTQSNHGPDEEYSTFCDRQWARTVTPRDNQDFYWVAEGGEWVTIDPAGYPDGPCWHRDDFQDAPEAIRNAVEYCP